MGFDLWEHQLGAVAAARAAIREGRKGGLWVMPTGSGKTVAFATLAAQLGWPALVVVHRGELARQAAGAFRECWPGASVGLLPGGDWGSAQVVVATVQSLSRHLGRVDPARFRLVVVDEAHHAPAASWRKVLGHLTPDFVLGCTATPERLDGLDVGESFGGVIYEYGLGQAMDDAVVVPVRQHGIRTTTSLAEVGVGGRDFARKSLAPAVGSAARAREVVEGYLPHAGRPALVFAADLAHAEQLRQELVRRGVAAATVSGKMKQAERARALGEFRDGRLGALVSCDVLTEGYDERRVGCVVMARPTASVALYTQCVGRGLRLDPASGKEDCLVLDVIDSGARRFPVVASDLFGARVTDCKGGDVREAAAVERARWSSHPISPSASLQAAWHLGEETLEELPDLEGYSSDEWWQDRPASPRQFMALRKGYRMEVHRRLTKGEASYLIDDCKWLEEEYHTPATPKQEERLRRAGEWKEGLSKREAGRRVAGLASRR